MKLSRRGVTERSGEHRTHESVGLRRRVKLNVPSQCSCNNSRCGGPCAAGSAGHGCSRPILRSISSAVRRLVTNVTTRRRPPQGHFQTSQPNVRCSRVAQSIASRSRSCRRESCCREPTSTCCECPSGRKVCPPRAREGAAFPLLLGAVVAALLFFSDGEAVASQPPDHAPAKALQEATAADWNRWAFGT
jgi:hypothetical protein